MLSILQNREGRGTQMDLGLGRHPSSRLQKDRTALAGRLETNCPGNQMKLSPLLLRIAFAGSSRSLSAVDS
ncbi:unnamed protein product [Chondrus crispus]|uniref:Uncharacterized protein n=1 Tax=Chondrus crispus TaxID=2769 RepID=R7Q7Z5_CHOCR|nr:unnamed protein product [Chondrus crispus]CDF34672.1 unnamed protein product [Chondrus crispus]|eukprot:XP_005714491.1 unnamed protein product [Chondrus crispus]